MPERLDSFLRELETDARARLAPEVAGPLLDEVRSHLDAAIQARLELGDSPEEAERQSIAAFGDIDALLREVEVAERGRRIDRRFFLRVGVGWLGLFVTGYLGWHFGRAVQPFVSMALLVIGAMLAVVIVTEGRTSRRLQILPILAMYGAFVLLGAVGQAYMAVPDDDDGPAIQRSSIPEVFSSNAASVRALDAQVAEYDAHRRDFAQGSLVAPVVPTLANVEPRYALAATRTEAANRWVEADRHWRRLATDLRQTYASRGAALEARFSRPWWMGVPGWIGVSAAIATVPAAMTLILNLVGVLIGWIAALFGDGRRKRLASVVEYRQRQATRYAAQPWPGSPTILVGMQIIVGPWCLMATATSLSTAAICEGVEWTRG